MNQLYVVRHGENLANLTKEFSYRHVDYSLTEKGILQAQQTAAYLARLNLQEIYTSPLKRARETAGIIAHSAGLPVTVIEEFREMNVGDLESQPPTAEIWEFHNRILDEWRAGQAEVRFPGGENLHELAARARAGLRRVLENKENRRILIVSHGGIFSFALLVLLNQDDQAAIRGKAMENCAITHLSARQTDTGIELRLVEYARSDHLSGDAARLVSGSPMPGELPREISR